MTYYVVVLDQTLEQVQQALPQGDDPFYEQFRTGYTAGPGMFDHGMWAKDLNNAAHLRQWLADYTESAKVAILAVE